MSKGSHGLGHSKVDASLSTAETRIHIDVAASGQLLSDTNTSDADLSSAAHKTRSQLEELSPRDMEQNHHETTNGHHPYDAISHLLRLKLKSLEIEEL